ncbi:MAG TPA: HNH endonuclease [Anaerolineales bacterium]|nr:HNH endonuclease [Anaerolineales bacterium]HNN13997.1 HNH endonuclease [Anaerolineales bacterium]
MKTYLFAWNPKRWPWKNLAAMSQDVKDGKSIIDRWSSSNSRKPKKGDRFFLIRVGDSKRGIFASGSILTDTFEAPHWDPEKSALGEITHYVQIKYDTLLDPDAEDILPRTLLDMPPLSEMYWNIQMSGVEIPEKVANELENLWAGFIHSLTFNFPEEIDMPEGLLLEGAVKRVTINAYERNPTARKKCIAHFGVICQICGFDFEKTYGEAGKGLIHVHHLKPLSEIGQGYEIDPIQDMIPICPNCHAIIHRQNPPYTPSEVKEFLQSE